MDGNERTSPEQRAQSGEQTSPETQPPGNEQASPEAQPPGNEQTSLETQPPGNEQASLEAQPPGAAQRGDISAWLFLVQLLFWLTFVGATAWALTRNPGVPSIHDEQYPVIVATGLVLVAITPVVTLLAWFLSRKSSAGSKHSSFFLLLLKSAAVTAVGTAVWLAALLLIDIWKLSFA